MELYKEQVAVNGLKAPITIIPQKFTPEKSCASHTKYEVSELTARTDKGKMKVDGPRNDLQTNKSGRHCHYDDREIEYARLENDAKESAARPRVWDRLGVRVTQSKKSRPQNQAKQDLRKIIYSAIVDKKFDGKTTTEFIRKVLREDQGSPFTQKI